MAIVVTYYRKPDGTVVKRTDEDVPTDRLQQIQRRIQRLQAQAARETADERATITKLKTEAKAIQQAQPLP